MEGSALDSIGTHVRGSSAWIAPSTSEQKAFSKAVAAGKTLPSRYQAQSNFSPDKTYEHSQAITFRDAPQTHTTDEDKKVTVIAAETLKLKPKKKYWCCGQAVED